MSPARTAARPAPSRRAATGPAPPPVPTEPAELLGTPLERSGLATAAVLKRAGRRLGFLTLRELLFHLPRRYEDLREMRRLGDLTWLPDGTTVSARVTVKALRVEPTFRRRVQRTVATLADETGTIQATWFGRRFIERRLKQGDAIVVSGKVKRFGRGMTLDNPEFQREDDGDILHAGRIVPIYRLTAGLTAARLRAGIREALDKAGREYPEYLPPRVRDAERLPAVGTTLEEAHFPSSFEDRDRALRRIAFDELLGLQVGMVQRRRQRGVAAARAIELPDTADREIRDALTASLRTRVGRDVNLTPDQAQAIADIRRDLAAETPMLRLLQGDVGSGKTAVAAYALAAAARAGLQGALLAPTDLLARQHRDTVGELLAGAGVDVVLLAGSLPAETKRRVQGLLASGQASVVVGTHALIQEAVSFAALGLAVIDEQHRFGVDQRGQLEAKAGGNAPHVLLMTATPIPRTLGQVLYADLDVSDLRTPPEGRVPIRTGIRRSDDLAGTWKRVRDEAADGRRAFVVVPLIDESGEEAESATAAESEAERLRALLAPLRVGLVHGRLKPTDRDAEMTRFRDGELDVLVGTTVVEVGVDVPEATMMIVEDADRFGLAQLHQLRGRVGRGRIESYCVLVSDAAESTDAWRRLVRGDRDAETTEQARLVAIARTTDGFELAEKDFELRREGDVLGLAQSGLPRLRVASLQRTDHRELAVRARKHAEEIVDADGRLRAGHEALASELADGWLKRIAAGEPASAS